MGKIIFKLLRKEEIEDTTFIGFDRYQETKQVLYLDQGVLKEKEDAFIESWDEERLIELARWMKKVVSRGGKLIVAYDRGELVGFASLESGIFFDEYLNLDYIHVANGYRRKGIGVALFNRIMEEAKKMGAKKLYISSHPNVYTQKFYQSMGCVLAKRIHPERFKEEPLDIHLEKNLY